MGQAWSPVGDGGYLANPKLSSKLRYAAQAMMKFNQFVRPEPGLGKGVGDTLDFDKISDIAVGASLTGIVELNVMPESKFTITRGQLVMTEYGNSIPYTGKLEALAEFSPQSIIQQVLRNDMAKTIDAIVARTMKRCAITFTPTSATAGTFTVQVAPTLAWPAFNFEAAHVYLIRDYLKGVLKVEPYDGENYIAVGSIRALRSLRNSTDWKDAAKYGDPERLFSGEVGRFDGIRFIESNNDAALDNGLQNGGADRGGEMLFFGADPIVSGTAIAPEIRAKTPTDYGRSKGVAWYALQGYQVPWRADLDGGAARCIWVTASDSNVLAL